MQKKCKLSAIKLACIAEVQPFFCKDKMKKELFPNTISHTP